MGTEGRKGGDPAAEIPPNHDQVYDFIVFRASDVKDLKIEQSPGQQPPQQQQVPNDPAILGVGG